MVLAGETVTDESVRELADRLGNDALAAKLLEAMEHGSSIVSLNQHERSSLLGVLEDAPPALHPLRARLREQAEVQERRGRTRGARSAAAERQAVRTNCLVHFPDGKTAVHAVIRRKLEVGAEILDGWVISHLPQVNEREIDGKLVTTDVWVDKKSSDELGDKLELY